MIELAAHFLAETAAGLRIALVLLAAMSLLAGAPPAVGLSFARIEAAHRARPLQDRAWRLMAVAALCYSPAHASSLLGSPWPRTVAHAGDVLASGAACAAFMLVLASRATAAGLSKERVSRGILTNLVVAFGIVVMAWSTR